MKTLANGNREIIVMPLVAVTPLRERARIALEVERARTKQQEREFRAAELRRRRDALVRLMREVLDVHVELEAIPLPEAPPTNEWVAVAVTVEGLTFQVGLTQAQTPEGEHQLKVSLSCPVCAEPTTHPVPSLGALGLLLQQEASGSLSNNCPTCLMAAEWESDPFRDE